MKQTLLQLNILSLGFILLFLTSCQPEPTDPLIIISIDDEFQIDLWENLAVDASGLSLQVATIASVDCKDSEIEIDYTRLSFNEIKIALNDIIEPVNCFPAVLPATATVNVGYLPNGLYKFHINLKDTTIPNMGTLNVSTERYLLEMDRSNGFELLHSELLRVPNKTIWGAIHFQNTPVVVEAAANFVEEVKALGNEKEYLKGYYGHFSINEQKNIITNYETALPNVQSFIFNYTKDLLQLKDLVHQYREDFGEALEIKLFTWDGKEL